VTAKPRFEEVESAASELRNAIAGGMHQAAARFAAQYCEAVERAVRAPGEGAETLSLLWEALELLDWARRVALSARAHCARQLAAVHTAGAYEPLPERIYLVKLDG
jgi:hypothetical protein